MSTRCGSHPFKRAEQKLNMDLEKEFKRFVEDQKEKNNIIINDIKILWEEIEKLKAIGPSEDTKRIEDNVFKEQERLRKSMEREIQKLREEIQSLFLRIKILSQEIKQVKEKGRAEFSLKRDIESLKLKTQWLEDKLKEIQPETIFERLEEIEADINRMKATSPLVIE